ncbi:MAG: DUF5652 family protein [bacterium]|nr:DUF5652 family protein [bacterium]
MRQFMFEHQWIIYVLIAWTLPWKGMALWKAATQKQRGWFIVLFLINTLAILDILYLAFFGKIKGEEEKEIEDSPIVRNGNKIV